MPAALDPSLLARIHREEWGRLVATVIRLVGDIDRAEEIVQDALLAAMESWPKQGLPERPGAWLMTTARNRALDHLRRARRAREKHALLAASEPPEAAMPDPEAEPHAIADDPLRLIFTCCHPLLPRAGRMALTLRLLGGLSVPEIARAFLVQESTIAQRIVRAKRTIRERGLPYRVPDPDELPRRLPDVLEVLYLIFNEGYAAREGDALVRAGLCEEALRLAGLLAVLLPDEAEVHGLLALLELQASRQATRADATGQLVLLQDQDRSDWDHERIERARFHLAAARAREPVGAFTLQALIAECHARARSFEQTDWPRIVSCYDALLELTHSPVVELNRAVAIGMRDGAEVALDLLDGLAAEPRLRGYALYPATRADFLRRLGRTGDALHAYRRALALTHNAPERAYLERRIAECQA